MAMIAMAVMTVRSDILSGYAPANLVSDFKSLLVSVLVEVALVILNVLIVRAIWVRNRRTDEGSAITTW